MNIVLENRAQDIIEDVRAALASATVGGVKVFERIHVIDDARSFIRVSDVLKGPKQADAGIVDAQPEKRPGTIDDEQALFRMSCDVIVRFSSDRNAGEDEKKIVNAARRYTEIVRAAMLSDQSRGGNANLINFGGQIINGTDVSGRPRLFAADENTAFRAVLIPASIGWAVFS